MVFAAINMNSQLPQMKICSLDRCMIMANVLYGVPEQQLANSKSNHGMNSRKAYYISK